MLTVHHLDYSRSTRVLRLLEELGLGYELVGYARPVGGPAPAALSTIHPLGKSPVLVDDGFVLAESSAILRYIDAQYGDSRFTPQASHDRARHDEWLDYVEGSLALPLFVPLVAGNDCPDRLRASFDAQREKAWTYIAEALEGQNFLLGGDLTLGSVCIYRSQIMAHARWTKPMKAGSVFSQRRAMRRKRLSLLKKHSI